MFGELRGGGVDFIGERVGKQWKVLERMRRKNWELLGRSLIFQQWYGKVMEASFKRLKCPFCRWGMVSYECVNISLFFLIN